jgi:PAP2 superfamily
MANRENGVVDDCVAVETLRHASLWLTLASVFVAVGIVVASGISVDASGVPPFAFLAGTALLIAGICSSRGRLGRLADSLGGLGLTWIAGLASGVIAVVGLHMHFPLADGVLNAIDHSFGIDGLTILASIAAQPRWMIEGMSVSYFSTIPTFYFGMILLAILGDRLELWRATFCFIGTVLATCVISVFCPAEGLGRWASSGLIARLPSNSIRHFWPNFEKFYFASNPVLRVDSIGGVVSFPSFHLIMGLIIVFMWRRRPVMLALSVASFVVMAVATLPFGGHYVVDLVGGAAVWSLSFAVSRQIEAASKTPSSTLVTDYRVSIASA